MRTRHGDGNHNRTASEENLMSANDTFLAVFLGSKTSAKMAAWNALPEAGRRVR
jgi:hypothetical protein